MQYRNNSISWIYIFFMWTWALILYDWIIYQWKFTSMKAIDNRFVGVSLLEQCEPNSFLIHLLSWKFSFWRNNAIFNVIGFDFDSLPSHLMHSKHVPNYSIFHLNSSHWVNTLCVSRRKFSNETKSFRKLLG